MMLYYTNLTWPASDYIWEPALSISTTSVRGITLCLPYHYLCLEGHWCPAAARSPLGAPEWWALLPCPRYPESQALPPWRVRVEEESGVHGHLCHGWCCPYAALLLQVGREVAALAPLSLQPSHLWPQLPCVPSLLLWPGSQVMYATSSAAT